MRTASVYCDNECHLLCCVQMVNLLLNHGANLVACDKKERQAVHWAAYLGEFTNIQLLSTCVLF